MNQRRRTIVDPRLQFHFFWLWVLVSLGIAALVSIAALSRWADGLIQDPVVVETLHRVLWITGAYILVLSIVFGAYTVFHLHRVAGPAYRLGRCLEALRARDYITPITLRRKDYLQDLAVDLDLLRRQLAEEQRSLAEVYQRLAAGGQAEAARDVRRILGGEGDGGKAEARDQGPETRD